MCTLQGIAEGVSHSRLRPELVQLDATNASGFGVSLVVSFDGATTLRCSHDANSHPRTHCGGYQMYDTRAQTVWAV